MDLTRRQFLLAGAGGLVLAGTAGARPAAAAVTTPTKAEVLATVRRVNDQWIATHPDPGDNKWARATYFNGLTTLVKTTGDSTYRDYAQGWAETWDYQVYPGPALTRANDQCAGQAFFDLYDLAPAAHKIASITASVQTDVRAPANGWWWVDALYMAMPSWTRVATSTKSSAILPAMWNRYRSSRVDQKFWSGTNRLWFRDATYVPPDGKPTPSGGPMFWSRGNGWAYAAHTKILTLRPDLRKTWPTYFSVYQAMTAALRSCQRSDGFWNVDLLDPTDYPGPETSGTSWFLYGLAAGIKQGLLSRSANLPAALAAWNGLSTVAVQPDGSLGYVQGVGKEPASSQPVTATTTSDFGVGAFTHAGCALASILT